MQPTDEEPLAHGGDLGAVRKRFPNAPAPWLDLSTGINPVPYPVPELPMDSWSRLPTRAEEEDLLAAAATRYRVRDPGTIVAAPGTQALIQLLPRLRPKSRVEILGPTYEEHWACWTRQGHRVSVVKDIDHGGRGDVVIIANPNNPTGRIISASALRKLASALLKKNGLLIVDEAFIDVLANAASIAADLPPATVVLRSFGKAYGLAGLRLGFAVAEMSLARCIRAECGPWAVSGPALRIGRTALGDTDWLSGTIVRLCSDARRLDLLLEAAGLVIVGGTPLFRLACHPSAMEIVERLGRHGIHVRAFSQEPQWLRFGLPGDESAWKRLSAALLGATADLC